jgi:hypothetical protein
MSYLLADIVTTGLQRVNHHTVLQRAGISGMLHTSPKFEISNKNTSESNNQTSNDSLEGAWLMAIIALR